MSHSLLFKQLSNSGVFISYFWCLCILKCSLEHTLNNEATDFIVSISIHRIFLAAVYSWLCGKQASSLCTFNLLILKFQGLSRRYVSICLNGTWGRICSDFWDGNDASVVCRQLGYSPYGNFLKNNNFYVSCKIHEIA